MDAKKYNNRKYNPLVYPTPITYQQWTEATNHEPILSDQQGITLFDQYLGIYMQGILSKTGGGHDVADVIHDVEQTLDARAHYLGIEVDL